MASNRLVIRLEIRKSNDESIADIHNLIGAEQIYGKNHSKLASVLSNIGLVYFKQKNYSDALIYQKKVLNIQRKLLHKNHHSLGGSHNNIALTYVHLHNSDLALDHFHQALEILQKSLPIQHPSFATIYNNVGTIYIKKRNLQEALNNFEKAAAILNQTVGSSHPDAISIQKNIQYIRSYLYKHKPDWSGTWRGIIRTDPIDAGPTNIELTLELGLFPTMENNCTKWYGTYRQNGTIQVIKDYKFCRKTTENDYFIDEQNGIILDAQWIGNALVSSYKVDGIFFIAIDRMRENILEEEIWTIEDKNTNENVKSLRTRVYYNIQMKRINGSN
ncbi:hypothetical protein I4U23_010665 [Adineta vaga]|nr:hypothetical protein I4U23_010665 [Adineta vaga]